MTTIDYKQKIKDYMNSSEVDTLYKSMLNNLFPELKESEDERIRKAIIEQLKSRGQGSFAGYPMPTILAWFEKQGKNNMGISEATKKELEDKLHKALEKETPESCHEFLNEQDELDKESEDEKIRQFLIHEVEETSDKVMSYRNMNKKAVLAWLEKQGEQKPAWSEEDDMVLNSILDSIQREGVLEKKRKTDWLKSLRPQSHWKPSEEQLKALKEAVDEHFDIDGGALWHLYEDLKKLREECYDVQNV